MSPKPLAWEPETLEHAQNRLAEAFVREWDASVISAAIESGRDCDRPTLHREHVFDLPGGFRIGASKTVWPGGVSELHASVSLHAGEGEDVLESLKLLETVAERFAQFKVLAQEQLRRLTGGWGTRFIGASQSGCVFHFLLES